MLLSFHPCLPCCWCQYKTVGPLRSTDIAPLHRYYGPVRHPLAFPPISRFRRLYGFLLRRFRDGTRRASPVARCILVIVLPLPPRQSVRRIGQLATFHAAFALSTGARPLRQRVSGSPVRSLSLRPNDSLTIPRMALSIDFRGSVSFPPGYPSYRTLTFVLVGLTPTEYTSLCWTYVDSSSCLCSLGYSPCVRPFAVHTAYAPWCRCR